MSKNNSQKILNNLLLGDLVKTFIGPLRRLKCLEDGNGSRYFRHACLLLEQLDVEHPVYQYVISVSSEFRRQYGERAADDLLFYIHSWSRVIEDLIHMGIPMTAVTYHMKAVITECIQHIETKKIKTSEIISVSQNLVKVGNNSLQVPAGDMYSSASVDLQKNEAVREDCFNSLCAENRLEGNEHGTQAENTSDTMTEKDSHIVHGIETLSDDHKCRDTESRERRTNKDSSTLNEDGVEVIHLEMKMTASEIEDEDTSWFFDDVESSDRIPIVNPDNKLIELCEEKLKKDVAEMTEDEGNSDDSGAILTDIEKLKTDIEKDLKMINERKKRMKQFNVNESKVNVTENTDEFDTEVDVDFDSCFDLSDSEFSDCFEEKDLKAFKTHEKDRWDESKSDLSAKTEEFRIIQLKFANTARKENDHIMVIKTIPESSQQSPSLNILKSSSSKADVSIANKNSPLDIELQMCQKEYSKTQEMLKSVKNCERNKATATELVENFTFKSSENRSLELSSISRLRGDVDIQNKAKVKIKESVKKANQKSLDVLRSDGYDTWKPGQRPCNEDKIQEINSLLASVGKGSKTDFNKPGISSLKFHSRHFQDTVCKEIEQNKGAANIDQTRLIGDDVLDDILVQDIGCKNDDKMMPINRTSVDCSTEQSDLKTESSRSRSQQSNPYQSLKSEENRFGKSDGHLKVIPERSHNCIDLKGINSLLEDINSISSSCIYSKEVDKQASELPGKNRHESYSEMPDAWNRRLHGPEGKHGEIRDAMVGNHTSESKSTKSHNLQSSRMSDILLRSRHMNLDTELTENTKPCETAVSSEPAEQGTATLKGMKMQDNADKNFFSGNNISENKTEAEEVEKEMKNFENETDDEVFKEVVRRVVMGVNFDGDVDISKAVCDVVLKQSRNGKPRLNIDLVDCYSRNSMHKGPEVIDGVVVKAPTNTISSLQKLLGKNCRALLVNGDLAVTFRHKGYKPIKVKEFSTLERFTSDSCSSKFDGWLNNVVNALKQLSIDVLLVKGSISEDVVSLCELLDIVAIETIPYKQLVQLSESAQVDMVTYITLATEENVCTGLTISPWQQNWCDKMSAWNCKEEIVIALAENNPQTVILCGISPMLIDLKEQELWDCLHHVTSVLHYGYLVLGAGQTEEECVRFLDENLEILKRDRKSTWSQEPQCKQPVIESVMSSFCSYVHLFRDSEVIPGYAMEGFNSKVETWKTALDVVITISNIDSFITTGLTDDAVNIGTL